MIFTVRKSITWAFLGLATLLSHQVTANDGKHSSYQIRRTAFVKERGASRNLQTDQLVEDHEMAGWQYQFSQVSSIKDIPKPCAKKDSSCAPTQFPSIAPSLLPTHSPAPSSHPSNVPSISPTLSPTFQPSMRPTISFMPSHHPSSTPSIYPSSSPTHIPSQSPSRVPSDVPTISQSPTSPPTPSPLPYQETTTGTNERMINSCKTQPPEDGGILRDQVLAFQYNLYATLDADFATEVQNMEATLHSSLSKQFLTCNYTTDESFYFVSIDASPQDSFNKSLCAMANDPIPPRPSKCALVTSQLTMRAFFPQSRRLLQISNVTSSTILEVTGNYLQSSMTNGLYATDTIVQVSFHGFLTPPDEKPSGIRGNENDKTEESSSLSVTKSRLALGGAAAGLAVLVLALALVVVNHHRERQQEAYLKHLEGEFHDGEDDDDGKDHDENEADEHPASLGDWRVRLVIDESDFNISGDTSALSDVSRDLVAIQPNGRDFHQCNSATCSICQKRRIDPLFIQVQAMDRERLRAVASIRDSYRAPDTVDL